MAAELWEAGPTGVVAADPSADGERHHVLVVHGTWNAPAPADDREADPAPSWYEPGGSFTEALGQALDGTAVGRDAVWRPCEAEVAPSGAGRPPGFFHWSGENTHRARVEGGEALARHLLQRRAADPEARIHLVAHSHGGNVLLAGLDGYFRALEEEAEALVDRVEGVVVAQRELPAEARDPRRALAVALDGWDQERVGTWVGAAFDVDAPPRDGDGVVDGLERASPGFLGFVAREIADSDRVWSPGVTRVVEGIQSVQDALAGLLLFPLTLVALALRRLGAAIPRRRSRRNARLKQRLVSDWVCSPDFHRLGRMVWLGTPFIHARMTAPSRGIRRILAHTPRLSALLVLHLALAGALVWGGVAFVEWARFAPPPGLDPRTWPLAVAVVFAIPAAVWIGVSMWRIGLGAPPDRNVYFSGASHPLARLAPAHGDPRLHALVVAAGALDEAFLSLSTRPVVYAYLFPHLDQILRPRLHIPFRSVPARSRRRTLGQALLLVAAELATTVGRNSASVALLLLHAVLRLLGTTPTRFFGGRLLNVVTAASTGVDPVDVVPGNVDVEERLGVPEAFRETYWTRERAFARAALLGAGESETSDRFRFLWDELELIAADSRTWSKVRDPQAWREIRARFEALYEPGTMEPSLRRVCTTLDERLREIGARIHMAHSSYYASPEVIGRIARFLDRGGWDD